MYLIQRLINDLPIRPIPMPWLQPTTRRPASALLPSWPSPAANDVPMDLRIFLMFLQILKDPPMAILETLAIPKAPQGPFARCSEAPHSWLGQLGPLPSRLEVVQRYIRNKITEHSP